RATLFLAVIAMSVRDITRFEDFRGPSADAYGANALMGVINIITRLHLDAQGTTLKYTHGDRGVRDWYVSQGGGDFQHNWRLSLSGQPDDGFDRDNDGYKCREGLRASRMMLRDLGSLPL